jgi:aspartate aminotransferase
MKQKGIDVISFGAGEPDFDTPAHIKESAKKALDEGFTKYTPASGIKELKGAVCKKFREDNNLTFSPEEILVSCGAKHSIFNAILTLCDEGDEVILPSPYWVSYPEMIKVAGGKPVILKTTQEDSFKIKPEQLKSAITSKTKLFILNSPSNPTGMVYTKDELQLLSDYRLFWRENKRINSCRKRCLQILFHDRLAHRLCGRCRGNNLCYVQSPEPFNFQPGILRPGGGA